MQQSILSRAANNLENTTPDNSLDIKNTGGIYLSVIVPAYNEGERLPKTLRRFDEYFSKEPYSYEILIVADGPKEACSPPMGRYVFLPTRIMRLIFLILKKCVLCLIKASML